MHRSRAIPDEPARIDVAHDPLDRLKGQIGVRHVVHGEKDANDDLRRQHERQYAAERPEVIEVSRDRIRHSRVVREADNGQSGINPASKPASWLVGAKSGHLIIRFSFGPSG
jgi:hypothetical protein